MLKHAVAFDCQFPMTDIGKILMVAGLVLLSIGALFGWPVGVGCRWAVCPAISASSDRTSNSTFQS